MINEKEMTISIVWGIEDVRNIIEEREIVFKDGKELSDKQCFCVLTLLEHGHDANEGINNESIEWGINYLYHSLM